MSAHRFFAAHDLPEGAGPLALPLEPADLLHAARSLRLKAGETVEIVEPTRGRCVAVELTAVSAQGLFGRPIGEVELPAESGVTLVMGVAKGEKMDRIVRQCVELGVSAILPVITERSVVRVDAARAAEKAVRWARIAHSAAEQSRAPRVPRVLDPVPLTDAYALLREQDATVVVWEEASGRGVAAALRAAGARFGSRMAVVVGPEGGLSASEVAGLTDVGAVTATLGSRILRTETAAVVATALVMEALGLLGGSDE